MSQAESSQTGISICLLGTISPHTLTPCSTQPFLSQGSLAAFQAEKNQMIPAGNLSWLPEIAAIGQENCILEKSCFSLRDGYKLDLHIFKLPKYLDG